MKIVFIFGAAGTHFLLASAAVLSTVRQSSFSSVSLTGKRNGAMSTLVDSIRVRKQQVLFGGPGCGTTVQTTASSQRGKICPDSCPLHVQDKTDSAFCSFRCVPGSIAACKGMNPKAPVPDFEQGICRPCAVSGCHDCATDGTDTCLHCKAGQTLVDGACVNYRKYIWFAFFGVVGVLLVFVVAWVVSLIRRPITNAEGLERGLQARSNSKLHMPKDEANPDQARNFWPLSTNLLTTPVAGNGVLHLFNFQFILILWAAFVLLSWIVLGLVVDTDFFRLGTRSPGETARDNCIIIAWGFTTQSRLMQAKYLFCLFIYVMSFAGALFYAAFQLRRHQALDAATVSHKDFCAKVTGLPRFSGKQKVEDELKETMQKATGQKVLGVSICWDFSVDGKEETLMKVIDSDTEERQRDREGKIVANIVREEDLSSMNAFDRMCAKWEAVLLSPTTQKIIKKQTGPGNALGKHAMKRKQNDQSMEGVDEEMAGAEEIDVVSELEQLYSTEDAFIIFDSEFSRDAAIEAVANSEGVDFYQAKLQLEESTCEPCTVQWNKITNRSWAASIFRCFVGFLAILVALAVWCFCFYLPYAQLVVTSDYAHGRDPNVLAKTMFGFVVIAGNAMMYVVCAEVSDRVGFKTQAKREVCYMLLYCFACVFNVLLDLVMAYQEAYKRMVGMGVKTHSGERLGEVDTFADRFDTYAMQKSLGQILLDYSFPSTFLIPFLAEPFVVVIVPYMLMSWIVRTNPSIMGSAAEAYLQSTPMDLSRYADVILNLLLAVLMFFFPGGYMLTILIGLIVSHIWIYAYDHYRVISTIPACDYSTMDVDWWAQWMLSIPCGLLLACAAFKANCEKELHCWEDGPVIWWCFALLLGHMIVHTLVLLYVIPLFSLTTVPSQVKYKTVSEGHPCSFFAANPVHCLRSKYIFQHDPPCDYFILGKDHLQRRNEDLHLFYTARTPRKEVFDIKAIAEQAAKDAKDHAEHLKTLAEQAAKDAKDHAEHLKTLAGQAAKDAKEKVKMVEEKATKGVAKARSSLKPKPTDDKA